MGETVADIYVRISKIKHRGRRETLGVERQEPPCRAFCEQQGWRVRKVWVDNGVSAVKAKHRKEFEAMLADVRGEAGAWWGGKWRPFGGLMDGVSRYDRHAGACCRAGDGRCPRADVQLV